MLYPKNQSEKLSQQLFAQPTSEYRAAPFWAWNCRLDEATLKEQIDVFERMGMGGFFMHVRTGLETPYMNEDFMRCIRACVEKAKSNQMLAYLYDEDRWPSGAAGGKVTQEEAFRARYLLFTQLPCGIPCGFGRGNRRLVRLPDVRARPRPFQWQQLCGHAEPTRHRTLY